VVVIVEEPMFIFPNPEVIEPLSNAPVVTIDDEPLALAPEAQEGIPLANVRD